MSDPFDLRQPANAGKTPKDFPPGTRLTGLEGTDTVWQIIADQSGRRILKKVS